MQRSPLILVVASMGAMYGGIAQAIEPAQPTSPSLVASATSIDAVLANLPIPPDYVRVRTTQVAVERQALRLIRYERADDRNSDLGGEHVSVLLDRAGRLKGFSRLDLALRGGDLPLPEEARDIARSFLASHAGDLRFDELMVERVAPHERMLLANDAPVLLGGMKVKMRNAADGRWLWVTVGTDRQVVAFERDVVWAAEAGGRQFEQWLDDGWVGRALERLEERGA